MFRHILLKQIHLRLFLFYSFSVLLFFSISVQNSTSQYTSVNVLQKNSLDQIDNINLKGTPFSSSLKNNFFPSSSSETKTSPKIAWLLSYPGSGAEFILKFLHTYTNTTTATNYADAHIQDIKSISKENEGPFHLKPLLPVPQNYILTLTYCSGRCFHCSPKEYMIKSTGDFFTSCCKGVKPSSSSQTATRYHESLVAKALIFIRNPFHVIEDRFVYYAKQHDYSVDRSGFLKYCHDDYQSHKNEEYELYEPAYFELAYLAPCHAELYRYIQWYNLALDALLKMRIPFHVMHHEQLEANALFEFLQVNQVEQYDPKILDNRNVDRDSFLLEEDRERLTSLIRIMANQDTTLEYFKRYLDSSTESNDPFWKFVI